MQIFLLTIASITALIQVATAGVVRRTTFEGVGHRPALLLRLVQRTILAYNNHLLAMQQ